MDYSSLPPIESGRFWIYHVIHHVEEGIDLNTSILIIGGGLSGMRAAAELLQQGFEVILTETGPRIGGDPEALRREPRPGTGDLVVCMSHREAALPRGWHSGSSPPNS